VPVLQPLSEHDGQTTHEPILLSYRIRSLLYEQFTLV
jgi:hypothetical protein